MSPDPAAAGPIVVTHLVKGLGPGGAERLILTQVQTGDHADFDYRVVRLIDHKDHLVPELRSAGVDVASVGAGPSWPLALARHLRSVRPDIVHAHSPLIAAAVRLLRLVRGLDARVVSTEHNRWPRHHRLTRALNRATGSIDDLTIAVSDDVRSSMSASRRPDTIVIHHGIAVDDVASLRSRRDEVRTELGIGPAQVVIGIVANFRPEKDYETFLAAASAAVGRRHDLYFVVVGQGPGEIDFRRRVEASGLADRVTVTGYRPDAVAVMSAFDVFTLTSRHEGRPVALLEAMALGLPVVATRAGGIPETITAGHDGLLVAVGDAGALADGWARLADDPERRRAMGQAAIESARSFDASASTREIESLYRRLMTGSGRPPRSPAARRRLR